MTTWGVERYDCPSETAMSVENTMNTSLRLTLNILLAAMLALAGFAPAQATPQADVNFAGMDAFVQGEVQAASIPGLAYGIVQDGRVVHMAAFGVANREDGRPMTPRTPMLINS